MRLRTLTSACFAVAAVSFAQADERLPTGQTITPLAAPGSTFLPLTVDLPQVGRRVSGQAVASALSADGRTLFVLTSGYNVWNGSDGKRVPEASSEHVFIYDVSGAALTLRQALPVANAYGGLVLGADGRTMFVAGGVDDVVHIFGANGDGFFAEAAQAIPFGHDTGNGLQRKREILKPMAAGAALTRDGKTLVVANYENDSISIIDVATRRVEDLDLRPGKISGDLAGIAGGEFPYGVAVRGSDTAYVSSLRDREIVVVALGPSPHVIKRVRVAGNPNRLTLNRDGTRLFVASDNADCVDVIDTANNRIVASIPVAAPAGLLPRHGARPGASPNNLALSPDERFLYVSDGGTNAIAVVELSGTPRTIGLIPTAWQPNAVSVSGDGRTLFIANGKSAAGPNAQNCADAQATEHCSKANQSGAANQYVWQLTSGGVAAVPVPEGSWFDPLDKPDVMTRLTHDVARNNGFGEEMTAQDRRLMQALRQRIHHVIYIVKENRTYDQVLGDVSGTDGDPSLVQFGAALTPNQHALARNFVALDAFFDSGEASGDGWNWTTAARTTDATEKMMPVNYGGRGLSYDFEGPSRGVNVALDPEDRARANPLGDKDPDLLPGHASETAPDGPEGEVEQGRLWDAALRAHVSVRNYGFFLDIGRYFSRVPEAVRIPLEREPFALGLQVAFPANVSLAPHTDIYFRGFDTKFADYWRYREWEREFDRYAARGDLPQLSLVRFMNDHMGEFDKAQDGVNTPELQVADNDYAVGLLVEKIAKSRFAKDTLIFVIEDDAQDGPDHIDAHRSIAFIAGPYVKQGAVISQRYTTLNMLRTIEAILGLKPLNLHDAGARPMSEAFDLGARSWTFAATPSEILRGTQLPLAAARAAGAPLQPMHDAAYWAKATRGFDFSSEDRLDSAAFNRILWDGLRAQTPYPEVRSGVNLRDKR